MAKLAGAALGFAFVCALFAGQAGANEYRETPFFAEAVAAGDLPPVGERVPAVPAVSNKPPGKPGGAIDWLARRSKDIRIMNVYGYARLVGYAPDFTIQPDILESIEVEEERIFTLKLRAGHKWSDGAPFTSDDFAYYWNDIENNGDLKPYGPDIRLLVEDEPPIVEIVDPLTVRYTWSAPNPEFLPAPRGRPAALHLRAGPLHAAVPRLPRRPHRARRAGGSLGRERLGGAAHPPRPPL